ncbi:MULTISPECIES: hypothetical protein [unclassified Bradyrhizobium]|uniref:hypothetical protein n=1 Tax=unclassified Bradyrhizobium TaxID=2631580 RepID=UPI001FF8D302|nr:MULTISPECIES: hypothetical protein [unclassified Bradyrhizobium]MCK1431197.1 hypothetical protein [Bradyrhizobium sp. 87]MCK1535906.1 hypothetical protein [Bradyrhizobium sp. 176]MCK1555678.1 hypothetical protein [Bradyrhizobium sp. 171]MCK1663473.1 hypothetical protein [Bradyrhizobium sp. 151]
MKGYFEKRRIAYGALAALFLVSPEVATAGERSTETPECKEITARIIERTNTHFDHFSPSGGSVFFKGPDMVLICDPKFVTYVSLNWDASGFPPNDWFALAATAGSAVTGADTKKLEAAAHRCHRAALKEAEEQASVALPSATVGCQAFTRDGGGVVVDVAIPVRKN